jgi:hypothetical protein
LIDFIQHILLGIIFILFLLFEWRGNLGSAVMVGREFRNLLVQIPSQVVHDERSEEQLHESDRVWEESVEHKL